MNDRRDGVLEPALDGPSPGVDPDRTANWRSRSADAVDLAIATARTPFDRSAILDIQAYCMFIGYPRSGHSLVGSLLDAHPEIVLAHELDALRLVQSPLLTRRQLYSLILMNERRFTDGGRRWTEFRYEVPGQWQGRVQRIKVIGDKKGGRSTRRLAGQPDLLNSLRRLVQVDVKLVHVIRNPFDNIATMHRREGGSLEACIERYFLRCRTNAAIKAGGGVAVLDIRHEALLDAPQSALSTLCEFLGVAASADYLTACSRVLFKEPHRSRREIAWSERQISQVRRGIESFEFLHGYQFDS